MGNSYRALTAVPGLGRIVLSGLLSRTAESMLTIALVLFVLQRYHSPQLAGLAIFLSTFPGVLVSPIAGALLDREGRVRMMAVDFIVAATCFALIGLLTLLNALPVAVFMLLVAVGSITAPLSWTGLRTLFPTVVPEHMWARANAVDSASHQASSIMGPAIAGFAIAYLGGPGTMFLVALIFLGALAMLWKIPDKVQERSGRSLWRDALDGVRYVARNPTLRTLAVTLSVSNVANGIVNIATPTLLLNHFKLSPAVIGTMFSIVGVVGIASSSQFGRLRIAGRERQFMGAAMIVQAAGYAMIALAPSPLIVGLALVVEGICWAPIDISLFTLRQRRTDPAWFGRAFAVSMMLNFSGIPIGSALGGPLAALSLTGALWIGVVIGALSGALPALIPGESQARSASAIDSM